MRRVLASLLREQRRELDQLGHLGDGSAVGHEVGAVLHPEHPARRPAQGLLHEDALDPLAVRGDQHLAHRGVTRYDNYGCRC